MDSSACLLGAGGAGADGRMTCISAAGAVGSRLEIDATRHGRSAAEGHVWKVWEKRNQRGLCGTILYTHKTVATTGTAQRHSQCMVLQHVHIRHCHVATQAYPSQLDGGASGRSFARCRSAAGLGAAGVYARVLACLRGAGRGRHTGRPTAGNRRPRVPASALTPQSGGPPPPAGPENAAQAGRQLGSAAGAATSSLRPPGIASLIIPF